jgi:hypothetical protein
MPKLTVEIVTPERKLLSTPADEVIVPGAQGLFGVRPGHAPFLSLMEAGGIPSEYWPTGRRRRQRSTWPPPGRSSALRKPG